MKSKTIGVIMGGGRGSRLQPLTKLRCKPAVPLAGRYRLVDIPISNCLNSGINRLYVLTQFNTASLHHHIQNTYKFDPFGGGFVDILSAQQTARGDTWYQGTADAVRQNMIHFRAEENDRLLILSGDQLYRMDFRDLIAQHERTGADITIATKALPRSRIEGLGVLRADEHLSVVEFVEKPQAQEVIQGLVMSDRMLANLGKATGEDYCLVNLGIYLFNRRTLFETLERFPQPDFSKELIPGLLGRVRMDAYIFDGYWEDIGTVRSFFEANLRVTDSSPPFDFYDPDHPVFTHARHLPSSWVNHCQIERAALAEGCHLDGVFVKRSVIGVRSNIGQGSRLENVVMMGQDFFESPTDKGRNRDLRRPDIGIGQNCYIRNAIIDKNARIGHHVRLSPEGVPDGFEQGDIIVREGVLIVPKNGVVPDNTALGG